VFDGPFRFGSIDPYLRWRLWWSFFDLPFDSNLDVSAEMSGLKAKMKGTGVEEEVRPCKCKLTVIAVAWVAL
jgi:hypothetical protein